jgi:hypothetical protein
MLTNVVLRPVCLRIATPFVNGVRKWVASHELDLLMNGEEQMLLHPTSKLTNHNDFTKVGKTHDCTFEYFTAKYM